MAVPLHIDNHTYLIPEADDPCDFWTGYFAKLKSELGRDNAKILWLMTWKHNGSTSCTTNPNFNSWLQKNELNVSTMASRTIADISEIGGQVFGLSKQMTKILAIGVPVVLIAIILGILVVVGKTAKDADLSDIAKLTPTGRGIQLLT